MSCDFHFKLKYVSEIRKLFLDTGDAMVFEPNPRGQGVERAKVSGNRKISNTMLCSFAVLANTMHIEGKGVVARHICIHLLDGYEILIHRRTAGRMIHQLGLTWASINPKQKTFALYYKVVMQNFLVELDLYVKY